jgi:hypothetical protein
MEVLSGSLASMKRMKGVGGRRRGEPGARDSVWQLLVGSSWEKNHSRKTFYPSGPQGPVMLQGQGLWGRPDPKGDVRSWELEKDFVHQREHSKVAEDGPHF